MKTLGPRVNMVLTVVIVVVNFTKTSQLKSWEWSLKLRVLTRYGGETCLWTNKRSNDISVKWNEFLFELSCLVLQNAVMLQQNEGNNNFQMFSTLSDLVQDILIRKLEWVRISTVTSLLKIISSCHI